MYLKIPNEVTKAARPSLTSSGTHEMSGSREVKGEATEASASDKDMPALAAFRKYVQIWLITEVQRLQ